jgi:transposase-like protein
MMGERGVTVDHSTLNRWVITLDEQARFGKRILRVHVDVGRQRAEAVAPL